MIGKGFLHEKSFSSEAFLTPQLAYCPVYTWAWNATISDEETEKQLAEMARLGIKRFYILPIPRNFRPKRQPSELSPEYLSEEFFKRIRYAVTRAKALGMEMWLYDEGGWPSGGACGKVVESDPSLIRETVSSRVKILKKDKRYIPDKDTVCAFSGAEKIDKGYIPTKRTKVTEYYIKVDSFGEEATLPDLTKKGCAKTFIELTHEKYKEYIGEFFGDTVTAVFCDEPAAPRPFPYREELRKEFSDRTGKDVTDVFPYLFGVMDAPEKVKKIITEWYAFLAEKFCDFLSEEKAWCARNGLAFVGHMDKDDEVAGSLTGGSYDLMRALSVMDVPGVDVIYRQIFPKAKGEEGKNFFFPRLASSAAAQGGNRHALTESFAVYGNGLTYEEMRYVLNFQAMRGINVYNFMLYSYGRTGYLRTGELPHFAESHACYSHLAGLNAYAERLSYLFTLGERVVPVALYFPIRDLYAGEDVSAYETAGKLLEKMKIDFDVITGEGIKNADPEKVKKGVLAVGLAKYSAIVVPACRFIMEEADKVLQSFEKGGGTVLRLSEQTGSDNGISSLKNFSSVYFEEGEGFSACESILENGRLLFVMNETSDKKTCRLRMNEKSVYLLDMVSGKIERRTFENKELSLTLYSGEIAAILQTGDKVPFEEIINRKKKYPIKDWSFSRAERFVIGREEFEKKKYCERARKISLGDWRKRVGLRFSGTGEYRAVFSLPVDASDAMIDLGAVKYSCEVVLNGQCLGARVMSPYRFDLPKELLREKNELVVRVKNSVANEFRYTHSFRKYKRYQLTQYIKKERKYERSSLSGGLFGPVVIYFC